MDSVIGLLSIPSPQRSLVPSRATTVSHLPILEPELCLQTEKLGRTLPLQAPIMLNKAHWRPPVALLDSAMPVSMDAGIIRHTAHVDQLPAYSARLSRPVEDISALFCSPSVHPVLSTSLAIHLVLLRRAVEECTSIERCSPLASTHYSAHQAFTVAFVQHHFHCTTGQLPRDLT